MKLYLEEMTSKSENMYAPFVNWADACPNSGT